jgi:hypothetical protein
MKKILFVAAGALALLSLEACDPPYYDHRVVEVETHTHVVRETGYAYAPLWAPRVVVISDHDTLVPRDVAIDMPKCRHYCTVDYTEHSDHDY